MSQDRRHGLPAHAGYVPSQIWKVLFLFNEILPICQPSVRHHRTATGPSSTRPHNILGVVQTIQCSCLYDGPGYFGVKPLLLRLHGPDFAGALPSIAKNGLIPGPHFSAPGRREVRSTTHGVAAHRSALGVCLPVPDYGLSPKLAAGTTLYRLVWTSYARGSRAQARGHLPCPGKHYLGAYSCHHTRC